MTGEELFDLFAAHRGMVQEIARMDFPDVVRYIEEQRQEEPDAVSLSDAEIARRILDFAQNAAGVILIKDELEIVPCLDGDDPHVTIRRYGDPGTVRVYLYEVRQLVAALLDVAAEGGIAEGEEHQKG
jgi:hypothetical protein